MALSFALDSVWVSVEAEVGTLLNPAALKAMVTAAALSVLLTMTLARTCHQGRGRGVDGRHGGYLGIDSGLGDGPGFVRLWEEAGTATSLMRVAGHRSPGRAGAGDQRDARPGAPRSPRRLGGKDAMAAQGRSSPASPRRRIRGRPRRIRTSRLR